MKSRSFLSFLITLSLGLTAITSSPAKEDHDHEDHAKIGPTKGRVLTKFEPHAELLVNAKKQIEIRFLDEDLKVLAPQSQVVTITMGERSNPTKLSFVKQGEALVSEQSIPEGKQLATVIQIREKLGAKAVTERLNLNLQTCPTCDRLEYVCECEHDHEKKQK